MLGFILQPNLRGLFTGTQKIEVGRQFECWVSFFNPTYKGDRTVFWSQSRVVITQNNDVTRVITAYGEGTDTGPKLVEDFINDPNFNEVLLDGYGTQPVDHPLIIGQ